MAPFLSIVTRCYKRPEMLNRNVESLHNQADDDYEQHLIIDDDGRGVGWANRNLATVKVSGEYVMVLDDDDMLINDYAIDELKIATMTGPALVIFKADHKELGILPSKVVWNKRPMQGHIGSCDFITRRDIWERHIESFGANSGGDYAFLHAVWRDRPSVVWLDELLASVQRISNGAPE